MAAFGCEMTEQWSFMMDHQASDLLLNTWLATITPNRTPAVTKHVKFGVNVLSIEVIKTPESKIFPILKPTAQRPRLRASSGLPENSGGRIDDDVMKNIMILINRRFI
jgi:hypothetical protein